MIKRVLAYDDEVTLRKQLEKIFQSLKSDYQLMSTFEDANDVLQHIETYAPEIILLDIDMRKEDEDGLVALYKIKSAYPKQKVMMLTVFDSDDKIFKAICLGADAYMLKTDLIEHLPHEVMRRSLNIIFSDGSYLTPSIAKKILILFRDLTIPDKIQNTIERFKKLFTQSKKLDMDNMEYKLSPTQIAILEDIVNGMKSSEIAERREISENTVGTHIKAIYKKLEVNSRAKAVKKAIEERIIKQKK